MSIRRHRLFEAHELVCDGCGVARLIPPMQMPTEAEDAAAKRGWRNTRRPRTGSSGIESVNHCSVCAETELGGAE